MGTATILASFFVVSIVLVGQMMVNRMQSCPMCARCILHASLTATWIGSVCESFYEMLCGYYTER